MDSQFTDVAAYQAVHGNMSLCFCFGRSGTTIIRHHDDKQVFTVDLNTLEEQEHPAAEFFASVALAPILVDDMWFMSDPEGAQALVEKQFRAEEKCGLFRPK